MSSEERVQEHSLAPEQRVFEGTVTTAVSLAIQNAESLWRSFSSWEDKEVSDHCSVG